MDINSLQYIAVITTCPGEEEADSLTAELLEKRLAACVQASHIKSTYKWKGAVERSEEVRLLIKARKADYGEIETLVKSALPYENPEVIAIPIIDGSRIYFNWIDDETERGQNTHK